MRFSVLVITAVFAFQTNAWADGKQLFAFPTAPQFTTVTGPVFPGPGGAAAVNASSLLSSEKVSHLTFVNSVPIGSGNYGVEGTYTVVGKSFGFSAGYVGTVGGESPHGYLVGLATLISKFSLGVGVSKDPGQTGTPKADASVTLPVMDNMYLTAVLHNAAVAPQATVGLGLRDYGFQLELFVDMTPFNNPQGGNSVGTALTFGFGDWSFHAAGKQQTVTKVYNYTVGIGRAFNQHVHISVQYDDQKRLNAGLTLGL